MKASSFIRIFSLIGILTLLVLQYTWFKNSFTLMEHDLIEKAKKCLGTSIESELNYRMNGLFNRAMYIDRDKHVDGEVISERNFTATNDIDQFIQETLITYGRPLRKKTLDSIYTVQLEESIGFSPSYTLTIVDDSVKEQGKTSKFTFYGKITN